uniref:Importin subunit beta-1/Transportin-1-like TPR repeats domain-containing protein n=2 Tax=Daucus carota subsp. sativus TaxID=79200 RepID=A0A166F3X9_DAUCS
MAMDITQALLSSFMSVDSTVRSEAMGALKKFEEDNPEYYLLSLVVELSNDTKPDASRKLAGIMLLDLIPNFAVRPAFEFFEDDESEDDEEGDVEHVDEDGEEESDDQIKVEYLDDQIKVEYPESDDEEEDDDDVEDVDDEEDDVDVEDVDDDQVEMQEGEEEAMERERELVEEEAYKREFELKRNKIMKFSVYWRKMDVVIKSEITQRLLDTLGAVHLVNGRRHHASETASQLIARIARIWPKLKWFGLFDKILKMNLKPNKSETLKHATLEVFQVFFSDMHFVVGIFGNENSDKVKSVIKAIIQVMNGDQICSQILLAATKTLKNIFEGMYQHRRHVAARKYWWKPDLSAKVICKAVLAEMCDVRRCALTCLRFFKKIVPLPEIFMQVIFELTTNSFLLTTEAEAKLDVQRKFERVPKFRKLYPNLDVWSPLIQMYLNLLKHDEDQNIFIASKACVCLLARIVKDDVLEPVINFIEGNFSNSDWQSRKAVAHAYCLILEGPSIEKLLGVVKPTLYILLLLMKDEIDHVKYTTACTLSRMFELLHSPGYSLIPLKNFGFSKRVVVILLESLECAPCISKEICRSICAIARTSAFLLSSDLPNIVKSLVQTAGRRDGDSELRVVAYETLRVVIGYSAEKDFCEIKDLPAVMFELLETAVLKTGSSDDREIQEHLQASDLQASFFGVLQVIIRRMGDVDNMEPVILQVGDKVISLFFGSQCSGRKVQKEEMLVIGALACAAKTEFVKYMPDLYPYVLMGLQNVEEYQACSTSVGVVGQICVALRKEFLPYCSCIMIRLKDLTSSEVKKSVTPIVFLCYGNIAKSIGEHFKNYYQDVVKIMQDASDLHVYSDNSDDMVEYGDRLRQSIFEAFTCILIGLGDSNADLLLPYVPYMLQLIQKHKPRDKGRMRTAVKLLKELAVCSKIKGSLKVHSDILLTELQQSDNEELRQTAAWTQQELGGTH